MVIFFIPCEQFGVYYKRDPVHVQWPVGFGALFECASKCLTQRSNSSYYRSRKNRAWHVTMQHKCDS